MILAACISLALAVFPGTGALAPASPQPSAALAHVSNSFHFILHASLARVAPLFGPDGERAWAGEHWNPAFIYPQPGRDVEGAVFTIQHGSHKAVWINTVFDLLGGRVQYVYVIPDVLVTTVDVRLRSASSSSTAVEVTYVRTALDTAANDDVRAMGNHDRGNGPEWQSAIEKFLLANAR